MYLLLYINIFKVLEFSLVIHLCTNKFNIVQYFYVKLISDTSIKHKSNN